jgi:Fe-S oxidoreductase
VLQRTVRILRTHLRRGTFVVGLEPSCTAVFRSDAHELFPDDPDVDRLRHQTLTLAEVLTDHSSGWTPPHVGGNAIVQTHCHQHAILKTDADDTLLAAAGVQLDRLDSGCCGLAGNFGFERGHFDISRACAERVLLPRVRAADPADVVLADGFSCRTQIAQLDAGGRRAVHLAELLAAHLSNRGSDVARSR